MCPPHQRSCAWRTHITGTPTKGHYVMFHKPMHMLNKQPLHTQRIALVQATLSTLQASGMLTQSFNS